MKAVIFLLAGTCLTGPPFLFAQQSRLQQAADLFQKGQYEEARARYEKLAGQSNFAVQANLGLARVLQETGEYARAEQACRKALALAPNHPDALSRLGELLWLTGHYDEARQQFRRALQADPNHLAARLNLGRMQWEWGEKDAARRTLQFFISYYYSHPEMGPRELALVAEACIYLDRVRDANNLFREATQKDPSLWQAFVPWGELFLSKYNVADARGVFEDALKANPNCAAAHLGLARSWKFDSIEQARSAARAALRINPNLVPAHDFLAELEIATGDYEAALKKLKPALRVNPNSLSSRAWRAVAYFGLKDRKKFAEEEAALLALNPKYSKLYAELAAMLSRRYLFQESVEYYRKALALDPEDWSARAGLGTSLSRLGLEEEARQELEQAFERDPYNKYVYNLLTLFDDFDQYETHQFQNFTIRIHKRDDPVLAPYVKRLVRESFLQLVGRYNMKDAVPVKLEIFPEHDDFAVRCFGIPGAQQFLGICFGNVVAMDSPRARAKGDFVWGETLWHELVHVTHLHLTRNRIPRWLAEGIAVYETSRARPYWSMNLDLPFVQAFRHDKLLHLRDLDAGFNRPTSPGQVTLSYFQASKVVEFLVERYGLSKLIEAFDAFKRDMETPEVFEAVYNEDLDALNDAFEDFIRNAYRMEEVDYTFDPRALARLANEPARLQEKLADHPNNPFFNYQLGAYYKSKGEFAQAIPYLTRAKELFPRYVGLENPYKALAEIYERQGDKGRAIAELRALTERNGKDLEALNALARLALETNDYDAAGEALQKLIYIIPFEPSVHKRLASVYLAQQRYQAAIDELKILIATEPQDLAGAHCDLADAYLRAGRKAEAKKEALAALEIAPNYERAQEILLASLE